MKRNDLLTGESFLPNRITQKFSSSKNRIKYHNQKANKLRHSIMYVNTPLQKNIRILNDLMKGKDKASYHKQFMLGKGFTFNVMTHFANHERKSVPCIYYFTMLNNDDIDSVTFIRLKNN